MSFGPSDDAASYLKRMPSILDRCSLLITEEIDGWNRAHAGERTTLHVVERDSDGRAVVEMRCADCGTYSRISIGGVSGPIPRDEAEAVRPESPTPSDSPPEVPSSD